MSSIQFITRFWTDIQNQKDIYTAQHKAIILIKNVFDDEKINIPYPIRSLDFDNEIISENVLNLKTLKENNPD